MSNYLPTIGIEVHCELKTKTKIFSNSINGYGQMANSLTNVVDLGYPGTLPTLNKEVKEGETIMEVGSTGNSTGPHLHFEVRIDGTCTSPWSFVKKP